MRKKAWGKITIKKEDLRARPRSGVLPSKRHKDKKSDYRRKPKHRKPSED
jgi:hypothetical protein